MGDYDPIVETKTGSRLSEVIKQATETLHTKEKILRGLYDRALKQKWPNHPKIPSEPTGKFYGTYLVNRHGVWVRQAVEAAAGLEDLYVWRRIAKTQIDFKAMSYNTTPDHNWQHRYLITNETGEHPIDIDHSHLGRWGAHPQRTHQAATETPLADDRDS